MRSPSRGGTIGLAWLAGVCLLLGGCGGKSDRLSRAEFVSRANAACKRANERLQRLTPARTFRALIPTADRLRAIGDDLHGRLRSLKPPADRQKQFARFLRDLQAGLDRFSALRAAAQRRDRAGAQRVLNEIAANPSGQDAKDLGLTECARSAPAGR
jgi:hypothetical protein